MEVRTSFFSLFAAVTNDLRVVNVTIQRVSSIVRSAPSVRVCACAKRIDKRNAQKVSLVHNGGISDNSNKISLHYCLFCEEHEFFS